MKRPKVLDRQLNQAKLSSYQSSPLFKFGYQVPRNDKDGLTLDEKNGNTKYRDAKKLKISQHTKYSTFKSLGKRSPVPDGYKKIHVHFVYDVKHNGCHKARLVAGGHPTDVPVDSVYSGVVAIATKPSYLCRPCRTQQLASTAANIGNAYLEAETKEKAYIIGGPGFGELEGHTLIIHKALYGVHSSGLHWHERFANTPRDIGFVPSKADTDIWMRGRNGNIWEYIATYVDNLAIIMKDPKLFTDLLIDKYKYKLKGVEPITYHLGSDYKRDPDGTFYVSAQSYINKMIESYKKYYWRQTQRELNSIGWKRPPRDGLLRVAWAYQDHSLPIAYRFSSMVRHHRTIQYCNCCHDHVPLQSRTLSRSFGTD